MGASIFSRSAVTDVDEPSNYQRIEREILHLKNRGRSPWSTKPGMKIFRIALGGLAVLLVVLYLYDPFAYAYHKSAAMRSYLYLQRWGDSVEVDRLKHSGYFSQEEIRLLNASKADPKDYYRNTTQAQQASYDALKYLQNVDSLYEMDLAHASWLDKARYELFIRWGILPPRQWRALNLDPRSLG